MPTSGNDYPVIGLPDMPFSGTFEGDAYAIRHFTYINPGSEYTVALFRNISGTVRNVVMEDVSISIGDGGGFAPLACGLTETGTVENCYADGQIEVSGMGEYIGGLVAELDGTLLNCDANVEIITGNEADSIGGLVGAVYNDGSVSYCSSMTAITTGSDSMDVGGLVGSLDGAVTESLAEGSVSAGDNSQRIGGLAGYEATGADIRDCYSKASVVTGDSSQYVGGLAGRAWGDIFDSYSMGAVTAGQLSDHVGGLVGYAASSNTSHYSYWDTETSGQNTSATGTPKTTEQMLTQSSYQTWNYTTTWRICNEMNYPRLQWEPKPLGDFVCPEGVETADLEIFMNEWLAETMSADMAPDGGDGRVDLQDWSHLAKAWLSSPGQPEWDDKCDLYPEAGSDIINEMDLMVLSEQWLSRSAQHADIAPVGAPDGKVNLLDYCFLAENWLLGTD